VPEAGDICPREGDMCDVSPTERLWCNCPEICLWQTFDARPRDSGLGDTGADGGMDASADVGADAGSDGSLDAPADAFVADAGTFAYEIRIDFADWAADPVGNWVLLPSGTMNTRIDGLIDYGTGTATPVALDSDAEWISTGGADANWTMGDVDWLPQAVAQDAWGGNVRGNVVQLTGVEGAVRVEVVTVSGFPDAVRRVEVNGVTTTVSHRGRAGIDSATWDAQLDGTNEGDWLVWPRVVPFVDLVEVRVTPGIISAIRLSPAGG